MSLLSLSLLELRLRFLLQLYSSKVLFANLDDILLLVRAHEVQIGSKVVTPAIVSAVVAKFAYPPAPPPREKKSVRVMEQAA